MYSDDDLIPISSLMHGCFCPRRCVLIHVDGVWTENKLTAAGRVLHERVDSGVHESRRDTRIAATLRLVSWRLGVAGIADMVEFHRVGDADSCGAVLPNARGRWIPFPVEYKRGRPSGRKADEVQLCAQAMCLEEMLDVEVPSGALFYGETRRRVDVAFDVELRGLTVRTAEAVHGLLLGHRIPPAEYGKWCESCSLVDDCQPKRQGRSARAWIERRLSEEGVS